MGEWVNGPGTTYPGIYTVNMAVYNNYTSRSYVWDSK